MVENSVEMNFVNRPYSMAVITRNEPPRWKRGEYDGLPLAASAERKLNGEIIMPSVPDKNFIDQKSPDAFSEFEEDQIVAKSGYSASEIRAHGCGISSLHMALASLSPNEYDYNFPTVGKLALFALSLHRNDYRDNEKVIKVGTPVFNLKTGWYHDALLYVARKAARVGVYRCEYIDGLEGVARELAGYQSERKNALAIISVKNEFWRTKDQPSSVATHMVLVNGARFNDQNELTHIRISDSYVHNGEVRNNHWLALDEQNKKAFNGRVMFVVNESNSEWEKSQ